MNIAEEKISSLKNQLKKIDKSIRNLFSTNTKRDETFSQKIQQFNNLLPLLTKEIKEKDSDLNKYTKAIEVKKKPSKFQENEIKKHEKLERLLKDKVYQSKQLLKDSEKESEEIIKLKNFILKLESEKKDLISICGEKLNSDKDSNGEEKATGEKELATTEKQDPPTNIKERHILLIDEAEKVTSGYYEGTKINQAIKFYKKIIEGDKTRNFHDVNEKLVNDIAKDLKKYEIKYDQKISDLLDQQSKLSLKNQELILAITKKRGEIDSIAAKLKSNSGEFVGGSDFFVSFCDVQSVLLCFFVVFFSISNQDYEKFEIFFSTWNNKLIELNRPNNTSLDEQELKIIGKVKELVKSGVDPETITRNDADKFRFVFPTTDLFKKGTIKISSKGQNYLSSKLKNLISVGGIKQIRIEGHTEVEELNGAPKLRKKYRNNFIISVARADSVANIINKKFRFPVKSTVITGYGSSKISVSDLQNETNNSNSRIEIEVIRDKNINKKSA